MKSWIIAAGVVLSLCLSLENAGAITQLPFNRKIDLTLVKEVAQKKSVQDMVLAVQAQGIDVYKITPENLPSGADKPKFPFRFLKEAPANLKSRMIADPELRVRGLMISKFVPGLNLKTQAILLTPFAEPYDLLHELSHVLFERALPEAEAKKVVEAREQQENIEKRFKFTFTKMYEDMSKAQDPLWRRDIMNYTSEYYTGCFSFIKYLLAEEVMVEYLVVKTLKSLQSPLIDNAQIEKSKAYMSANLARIKTRLMDMDFVWPWLKNDVYGDETGFEIPLPEKMQARKKLDVMGKDLQNIVPHVEAIYEFEAEIAKLIQ